MSLRALLPAVAAAMILVGVLSYLLADAKDRLETAQDQASVLSQENEEFRKVVDTFGDAIDEVLTGLESVAKAGQVLESLGSAESPRRSSAGIKEEAQALLSSIEEQQAANRERIRKLEEVLAAAGDREGRLRVTVARLNTLIDQKDLEIAEWREKVARLEGVKRALVAANQSLTQEKEKLAEQTETLKGEKEGLEQSLTSTQQDVAATQAELEKTRQTAVGYVLAGPQREIKRLRERGILEKPSAFKAVLRVAESYRPESSSDSPFVRVSTTEETLVLGAGKEAQIRSLHKEYESYYSLRRSDGVWQLHLLRRDDFWNVARYLIVELE